jgi:hypothetical protein
MTWARPAGLENPTGVIFPQAQAFFSYLESQLTLMKEWLGIVSNWSIQL